MFNTLEDARRYLEKEVDLLDSIYDNFQTAKSSPTNMLQYLKQFESIVEGVKSNKVKVMLFTLTLDLIVENILNRSTNRLERNNRNRYVLLSAYKQGATI